MSSKPRSKPTNTPDKKQTFTVRELRAWIEGIEELQGADWVPNADQWKKIKAKIHLLPVEEIVVDRVQSIVSHQATRPANESTKPAQRSVQPTQPEEVRIMPTAAFVPSVPVTGPGGKEPYKTPFA